MSADALSLLALAATIVGVLVARRVWKPSLFPSLWRGNPTHADDSGIDVLRVGAAALITLCGDLRTEDAGAVARRCEQLIADGVAHLVVELEEARTVSAPALQLLLYLVDLERMRGGRVCVVYKDRRVVELLESAGVTEHISFTLAPEGVDTSR